MARATATLIDYGRVGTGRWPGVVSATDIIQHEKLSQNDIDTAISNLNSYYVPTLPGARTRCIDGRTDPDTKEEMLGAQVPGGAPGWALAWRLSVGERFTPSDTFVNDVRSILGRYDKLGFSPGGHRDEFSKEDHLKVGCGAIDAMDAVLAVMVHADLLADHQRITQLILGVQFDLDTYARIIGTAVLLHGREKSYFHNRQEVIKYLEARYPASVATLRGHHREGFIFVNLVHETTFASNRFAADAGIQAFGYDPWRSIVVARKLLPGIWKWTDRRHIVTAHVMDTIATLMVLTDGSQRLILRTLKPNLAITEATQR